MATRCDSGRRGEARRTLGQDSGSSVHQTNRANRSDQHAVDHRQKRLSSLPTPRQIENALHALLDKANRIADPFEQSLFTMVHLPYLQPFAGINRRTSRPAANLPLFRANLT